MLNPIFKNIKHHIHQICTKTYRRLLPAHCVLCGYLTHQQLNLCDQCRKELPILPHSCMQCAQFLPFSVKEIRICGSCLAHTPPFDRSYALFPYQSPIVQLIINLKFRSELQYALTFAELFLQRIKTAWYQDIPLPDVIIPIPLHKNRLCTRGFNQALEIAKPLAKALKIPLDIDGVKRIKPTLAQSSLTAKERQKNMAHAFASDRDYSHLSVAVLDDVITTGHTIQAFCRLLRAKGAKNIHVWCCARRG